MNDDNYIIEFFQIGNSVKVSAIDPVTLREVSIVGDARMSRESLTNAALQKLRYVLEKES
jgi:hypothetical protein